MSDRVRFGLLGRHQLAAARLAYVVVVLIATLSNLEFSWDLADAHERFARAFILSLGWRDAIDGLRNVMLFAGLGGVWAVTAGSGSERSGTLKATLVGFCLSATVEGLQCFSPVRTASVVDLATNTVGALIGALSISLLTATVRRSRTAKSYIGIPTYLLAASYGAAALCEALTPLFASEPLRGLEGGPASRLRTLLRLAFPLTIREIPVTDIPLFAPAGFLAVLMLSERGHDSSRAWPIVALAGVTALTGANVMHGAAGIPVRWEGVATKVAAFGFGAWAAHRWRAPLTQALRGAERARALTLAYAALLVLWGWRPFYPETRLRAIAEQFTKVHFVPLEALSSRVDIFSAVHVAQQFLLYLPLGALLAVWPLRLTGRWSKLWPAIWLALGIEVGHVLIAERFFDVTNALIACAGLGIGWIIVRHAGFVPYGASQSRVT